MTLTDNDIINLIATEINMADNTEVIGVINILWEFYSAKSQISGILQYLYTKRHIIDYLLGQYWSLHDIVQDDITEKQSQEFANLLKWFQILDGRIMWEEKQAIFDTDYGIAVITKNSPIPYDGIWDYNNPNNTRFSGRPILRSYLNQPF